MQPPKRLDVSPEVWNYLNSTRLLLPKGLDQSSTRTSQMMYEPVFGFITELSSALGIDVKIVHVYTDSIRSEAITCNEQYYIVHDQYLGQVMNMLNRIFLYESSRETKLTYFHKLSSQLFSRYGFYEESVFAASRYQESKSTMDHQQKQENAGSLKHTIYTSVQELYILLHEHAHLMFKRFPELLEELTASVVSWIEEFGAKEAGMTEELLLELISEFGEEERAFIEKDMEQFLESRKISSDFCKQIIDRRDLIEEFCCDRLALTHLHLYLSQRQLCDPRDQVQAIICCFLHLRTLQMMEARCSLETNHDFKNRTDRFDITEGLYATFYNARIHHAKDFCYDLFLESEDEVIAVHSAVTEMMDHHSDEILANAESVLSFILYDPRIRETMDKEFAYIRDNLPVGQSIRRVISAILHLVSQHGESHLSHRSVQRHG